MWQCFKIIMSYKYQIWKSCREAWDGERKYLICSLLRQTASHSDYLSSLVMLSWWYTFSLPMLILETNPVWDSMSCRFPLRLEVKCEIEKMPRNIGTVFALFCFCFQRTVILCRIKSFLRILSRWSQCPENNGKKKTLWDPSG